MRGILLDTHAFLWWCLEPQKLPPGLLEKMSDPEVRVVLSTVSSWEAQIKVGLGILVLSEPLRHVVERELETNGWEVLPLKLSHTWKLTELAPLHRDPFDRLLVAQALDEDLSLASRDPLMAQYTGVSLYWE